MQGEGIVNFGPRYQALERSCREHLHAVLQPSTSRRYLSLLLHGPAGSGKTAFAAHLAECSECPLIKCISPLDLVGLDPMRKTEKIREVFDEAASSTESIIILDEIE